MDHPRLEYSDPLPGDFRHPLYTDPNYLKKIPRTFGRANIEFHVSVHEGLDTNPSLIPDLDSSTTGMNVPLPPAVTSG